jgi:hypothetical protein
LTCGTKGEEDNDPLPQSGGTPDCRGVTNDQDDRIPVGKDRAEIQQRLRPLAAFGFPRRQRGPGNNDSDGTENAGKNESAAPVQERSDPAEKER